MAIKTVESEFFGEALTPAERLVAGITVALGVAGHLLLGTVAVLLLYVLLVVP